jgi:TM2 domain-containing membrane protein YozV/RNA polymerase subunit RPABC4/transcription elongation factor Spt4
MSCPNCGAAVSPGSKICAACGTPQKSQKPSGGFCGSCGTPLIAKHSPCPNCGHVKTTYNPQPNPGNQYAQPNPASPNPYPQPQAGMYKNEGTGLVLSIILGILTICGIGQIYAGKVGRGAGILIAGFILVWVLIWFTGFLSLIGWIVLVIWSTIDTKKLLAEYNNSLSQNGRAPW